jgi:hypothetical protein
MSAVETSSTSIAKVVNKSGGERRSTQSFQQALDELIEKAKAQTDDDLPPMLPELVSSSSSSSSDNDDADDYKGVYSKREKSKIASQRTTKATLNKNTSTNSSTPATTTSKQATGNESGINSSSSSSVTMSNSRSNTADSELHPIYGQANIRLMTAEEALFAYMGLSNKSQQSLAKAFRSLLVQCTDAVKRAIQEYQEFATCIFPAPLLPQDRNYLFKFLTEKLSFTVSSDTLTQITLEWHTPLTRRLDRASLLLRIERWYDQDSKLSSNNHSRFHIADDEMIVIQKYAAKNKIYTAFHACLEEIERDSAWRSIARNKLAEIVQQRLQEETQCNKRPSFIISIPVIPFLSSTNNLPSVKQYQTNLLMQTFNEFVASLKAPPYSYEISQHSMFHQKLQFRLSLPGFVDSLYGSTTSSKTHPLSSLSRSTRGNNLSNSNNNNSNNNNSNNNNNNVNDGYAVGGTSSYYNNNNSTRHKEDDDSTNCKEDVQSPQPAPALSSFLTKTTTTNTVAAVGTLPEVPNDETHSVQPHPGTQSSSSVRTAAVDKMSEADAHRLLTRYTDILVRRTLEYLRVQHLKVKQERRAGQARLESLENLAAELHNSILYHLQR